MNPVEEIKSRLDIVEIIGNYITLRQSGGNFKGLCPFHGEKTPSFMVNRERQMFRCFGCGEHGDMFEFVQKQENIDFPSALQLLAAKAGVTLPEKPSSFGKKTVEGAQKPDLYAINNLAAKLFHHLLVNHPVGKSALDYLFKRGVTMESISLFQIGYAPQNSTPLQALFKKNNYSLEAIRFSGSPDRFKNRIMFPLRDVIGNVSGFSGRALGEAMPKYLNTAETDLFHKNRFLYGLFEAKKAIGESKKVIFVEGQLDLVLAHQAGTNYTVATSGTALSDDHLKIIRRYSDTLLLALDGDVAGKKATERAVSLALGHGFDVQIVPLPEGSDPGEVIARNPEDWKISIAKPLPAIEWLFGYYFPESHKPSATEREKIYNALFPYIALQPDEVSQSWAMQHFALLIGVKQEQAVRDAFKAWKKAKANSPLDRKSPSGTVSQTPVPPEPETEEIKREKGLIGLLLIHPELLEHALFHLREEDFTHETLGRLYNTLFTWYTNNTNKSSSLLITFLEGELPKNAYQALQKLLFDTQTAIHDLDNEQLLHEYTFLVQSIRQRLRKERIENFAQLIAQAVQKQDTPRVRELMEQMQKALKQQ
jgi:DNA primase